MIDQFTEKSDSGPVMRARRRAARLQWPEGLPLDTYLVTCGCEECGHTRVRVGLPRAAHAALALRDAERAAQTAAERVWASLAGSLNLDSETGDPLLAPVDPELDILLREEPAF